MQDTVRWRRKGTRRARLLAAALSLFLLVPVAAEAGWRGDLVPRSHGPTTRRLVSVETKEAPGTILISTRARTLDLVVAPGQVARYSIGVAKDGFVWTGTVTVGRKAEWPEWRPPAEMLARDPSLPETVPPGPYNPLGARAIYLYQGKEDTLYRIHGSNEPWTIGQSVSSGCIRMRNADVIDLYDRVKVGTRVIVL